MRNLSKTFNFLPIEFRLLLSPDSDCVSQVLTPLILDVDVAMLAGRDKRFSRSISERSKGRLGVNSSVNSKTGVVPPAGVELTVTLSLIHSFSGGAAVIGVNTVAYH